MAVNTDHLCLREQQVTKERNKVTKDSLNLLVEVPCIQQPDNDCFSTLDRQLLFGVGVGVVVVLVSRVHAQPTDHGRWNRKGFHAVSSE